ncbi:MAG: alpha/beta fold hydrolase [Chloroflexota bacterium]
MKTSWLVFPKPIPEAPLRLFCFPYAGSGSAVYNAWARQLPDSLELCSIRLPGRESRLMERPFTHIDALLPPLLAELQAHLDKPFAFFGHSMGALIAFELTRQMRQKRLPLPNKLLLSGFRAPQRPPIREPIHHLPKEAFLVGLQAYGGTPDAVLAHPELLELVLPALKADFELVETYQYRPERPLNIPMTIFGSHKDTITPVAELEGWEAHTTAVFKQHLFSGDHFYLQTETAALLSTLIAELTVA